MAGQPPISFERWLHAVDWQDLGMLILAIWLFVSPWVFPYGEANLPGLSTREAIEISAYSTGAARLLAALLAILAISGFFRLMRIEKWLTFITGLLIALSPWVFGVAGEEHALAISNEVVVGLLTCVVSLTKTTRQPATTPV